MAETLPNGDRAILDLRKLEDYCLSPTHTRGRHKARVFREALGIGPADAKWLKSLILQAVRREPALELASDAWGRRWQIDLRAGRQGRAGVIRTLWIMRNGENAPRFVTCWVL